MSSPSPAAFFSYSREDSEFALRLAADLKAAGADLWLDQLDLQPGERWPRAVEQALTESPCVLVILSPTSVNSKNVDDEVAFALDEQKIVIPVLYRECKKPFRLRAIHHIDFTRSYDDGFKKLVQFLSVEARLLLSARSTVSRAPGEAAEAYVAKLTQRAATGDARAMTELGQLYGSGKSVPQDRTQAFAWYQRAAESGDADGMFKLALMYMDGTAPEKNETAAIGWYRKAAEAGHRYAMFKLAFMYEQGRGVRRDYAEAINWYEAAKGLNVREAEEALRRVADAREHTTKVAKLKTRNQGNARILWSHAQQLETLLESPIRMATALCVQSICVMGWLIALIGFFGILLGILLAVPPLYVAHRVYMQPALGYVRNCLWFMLLINGGLLALALGIDLPKWWKVLTVLAAGLSIVYNGAALLYISRKVVSDRAQ